MTRDEILEQLSTGKIKTAEAAKLLAALDPPTVKVIGTQFATIKDSLKAAQPVNLTGDGMSVTLEPNEFSTGSYGWSSNGKIAVTLPDGKAVRVQGSINLVVIGSKPDKVAA